MLLQCEGLDDFGLTTTSGGGGGRWRIEKRMQRKKWGLYSMREGKETERNGKKMRGMGMRERERERKGAENKRVESKNE